MHIIIERNLVFHALQRIITLIKGRLSSPILGHVLLQVCGNDLLITGTDIDIEIVVTIPIHTIYQSGKITAPARKLFDICRTLSGQLKITLQLEKNKLFLYARNSCFSFLTLPESNFPLIENWVSKVEFCVLQSSLRNIIELVQFSMGNQDVRYYLNGMLFEIHGHEFRTVATDGHRLSSCIMSVVPDDKEILLSHSVIIPRKGIISMMRMLNIKDEYVRLKIGDKNIAIIVDNYILTSRLISGIFPDYQSILFKESTIFLESESEMLRQAFKRASILCDEKFRVVKLSLTANRLKIMSSNADHEVSEEVLDVLYFGVDMEIAFNIHYILDVLNVIKSKKVRLLLVDAYSSVRIIGYPENGSTYIIMPVRL